mmetsp:Transcript_35416/g.91484  ORF Transcript_35416/g.91484 Transcript_35416/m.91484 type:complete len:81 (+) Transcript_35416:472-714(+)
MPDHLRLHAAWRDFWNFLGAACCQLLPCLFLCNVARLTCRDFEMVSARTQGPAAETPRERPNCGTCRATTTELFLIVWSI